MEPRSLTIGLAVVVVAFAAAFGLAKATSSPAIPTRAGAEVITPAAPSAIAGIEAGGAMPALRTTPSTSAKRTTSSRKAPATNAPKATTPKSTPGEPSTPAPSAPKASTPSTPAPSKPAPKAPAKPQPKTVEGETTN